MTRFLVDLPSFFRLSALAGFALFAPATRAGDVLAPGDIVAVGGGSVVRIDPATGAQTLLFSGAAPHQFIAVDRDELLYGSIGESPTSARIVRIDLAAGTSSILTSGLNLFKPRGIAIDEAGDLLVINERMSFFPPTDATFLRVDAQTGAQTVIAQNVFLSRPKDIAMDVDGTAVVADDTLWGAIYRADPQTGAVTVVSENQGSGNLLFVATYVAVAPGGMIYTNTDNFRGLVRVDPVTGGQFLSIQGLPQNLKGIKSSIDGDLFLAYVNGTIVRFDPITQSIVGTVTAGGLLSNISSMTVVPPPVEPPIVTCSVKSDLLWPPNHELLDVGLGVDVQHDVPTKLAMAVYSDEADFEPGSGHHGPDATDVAPETLRLRAERSGNGDGRVYLIVATASDSFGNVGVGCCTVVVPLAQSAPSESSVQAQAAAAAAWCIKTGTPPAGFVRVGRP